MPFDNPIYPYPSPVEDGGLVNEQVKVRRIPLIHPY